MTGVAFLRPQRLWKMCKKNVCNWISHYSFFFFHISCHFFFKLKFFQYQSQHTVVRETSTSWCHGSQLKSSSLVFTYKIDLMYIFIVVFSNRFLVLHWTSPLSPLVPNRHYCNVRGVSGEPLIGPLRCQEGPWKSYIFYH